MKLLLLFFVISLNFLPVSTDYPLLIGFSSFQYEPQYLEFHLIYQNNSEFLEYNTSFLKIKIYNDTIDSEEELKCSEMEDEKNKTHNCSLVLNENKFIKNAKVQLLPNYLKIYNGTFNITGDDIIKSSLAQETMGDLSTQNDSIIVQTFNFKEVVNNKNDIVIEGNMEVESLGNYSLKLGDEIYECSVNETRIVVFDPKGYIYEHLHGKVLNTSEKNYILIYVDDTYKNKDLVQYNSSEHLFLEIISAGNFSQNTGKNAEVNLYFRGSQDILSILRPYLKFTAKANYQKRKLRNLEETNITAYGTKVDNENKDIITYKVKFNDTSDKTILNLASYNDYTFYQYSDYQNPEKFDLRDNEDYINLTDSNDQEVEKIEFKKFTSSKTSFELDFNSNLLSFGKNNASYLIFPALSGNRKKEIKCLLKNKTNNEDYYKMDCSTNENVIAKLNTLIIKVPVLKNSRLRFLADETYNNKTLFFDDENLIDYQYNPDVKEYFGRNKNRGLSAGAIVAIVLASVAALVAVGAVFFFLARRTTTPPPIIKNQPDFNIVASTSNINN